MFILDLSPLPRLGFKRMEAVGPSTSSVIAAMPSGDIGASLVSSEASLAPSEASLAPSETVSTLSGLTETSCYRTNKIDDALALSCFAIGLAWFHADLASLLCCLLANSSLVSQSSFKVAPTGSLSSVQHPPLDCTGVTSHPVQLE